MACGCPAATICRVAVLFFGVVGEFNNLGVSPRHVGFGLHDPTLKGKL
jgi:hypothetical protein